MDLFQAYHGRWGYVNLDYEANLYLRAQGINLAEMKKSPLLTVEGCARAIKKLHHRMRIDASYGGWLEDRSTLWRGSYMAKNEGYMHLGVDFNVPAGTEINLPFAGTLVWRDDDTPDEHGWGPRIMVQTLDRRYVVIFAHLGNVIARELGSHLRKGTVIADVAAENNGGWFPHLHVQVMTSEAFEKFRKRNFKGLDGYAPFRDRAKVLRDFCDPLPFVLPF